MRFRSSEGALTSTAAALFLDPWAALFFLNFSSFADKNKTIHYPDGLPCTTLYRATCTTLLQVQLELAS